MSNGKLRKFGVSSEDRTRPSKLAARRGRSEILLTSKRDRMSTQKRPLAISTILRSKLRIRQCLFRQPMHLRRNISHDKTSTSPAPALLQIQDRLLVLECRSVGRRPLPTLRVTSDWWYRCSSCFSSHAKKSKSAFTPHRL